MSLKFVVPSYFSCGGVCNIIIFRLQDSITICKFIDLTRTLLLDILHVCVYSSYMVFKIDISKDLSS